MIGAISIFQTIWKSHILEIVFTVALLHAPYTRRNRNSSFLKLTVGAPSVVEWVKNPTEVAWVAAEVQA